MAKHNRNRRRMAWAAPIIRDLADLADRLAIACGEDTPALAGRAKRVADRIESRGRPVPRVRRL